MEAAAAGTVIAERYRLDAQIGEGAMGKVYAATHVVTGRRLAIKLFASEREHTPEQKERFLREARAPAAIHHPNVVDILDAGTDRDGTPFIAMELLEGETLEDVLRREGVVQPARLQSVMDALLSALEAMHAAGLVHRDLKPANVFLAEEAGTERVKLLDFGIAKPLGEESRTRAGTLVGTPAYMAPEQVEDPRSTTPRSDLWSVGVMLYECLAGHRPFRGPTLFSLLHAIGSPRGPVPLAEVSPGIPDGLSALVQRLLSHDPSQRPLRAAEVRTALRPLLTRTPTLHAVEPPASTTSQDAALARMTTVESTGHGSRTLPANVSRRSRPSPTPEPVAGTHEPEETASHPSRPPFASPSRTAWLRARWRWIAGTLAAGAVAGVFVFRTIAPSTPVAPPVPDVPLGTRARPAPIRDLAPLEQFLRRWHGTLVGSQGRAPLERFYASRVNFNGMRGLRSPADIRALREELFRDGGSFALDVSRTEWFRDTLQADDPADTACTQMTDVTPGVLVVRAWATENNPDRPSVVPCKRLEGRYLLWLRTRRDGSFAICHETWSLQEGVCVSCPQSAVCR